MDSEEPVVDVPVVADEPVVEEPLVEEPPPVIEEVVDPHAGQRLVVVKHHALVRLSHWLNVPILFGMIASSTLAKSTSPFAEGANVIFGGTWGGKAIAVVAMFSIFGVLNGWILLQGRVPLGAAKDGLFPKQFGRVDEKRGTPAFGIIVSSLLITALLAVNFQQKGSIVQLFTDVIIIATLTALIPYAFASAAQIYLFITDRESFSGVNLARYTVIAFLALAYSSWAIWGAGFKPVTEGFMLLLGGIPVFLWVKWRQSRELPEAAALEPLTRERAAAAAPAAGRRHVVSR